MTIGVNVHWFTLSDGIVCTLDNIGLISHGKYII